jgi:hypothetical protein
MVTVESPHGALKNMNSITAGKLLIDFFSLEKKERWKQEMGKLKT